MPAGTSGRQIGEARPKPWDGWIMGIDSGLLGNHSNHSGFLATNSAVSHHFGFQCPRSLQAPHLQPAAQQSPRAIPHMSKTLPTRQPGIFQWRTWLPTPLHSPINHGRNQLPLSLQTQDPAASSFLSPDASRAQSTEQHKAFSPPHSLSSPQLMLPCCRARILPVPSSLLQQHLRQHCNSH